MIPAEVVSITTASSKLRSTYPWVRIGCRSQPIVASDSGAHNAGMVVYGGQGALGYDIVNRFKQSSWLVTNFVIKTNTETTPTKSTGPPAYKPESIKVTYL